MLKKITTILYCLLSNATFGQSFLNGNFELNSAVVDQINLTNVAFNSFMSNCNAFGTFGNMDIITSSAYSGGPQSGNWFAALTGGGTDMIALSLNLPLISGNSYTISFYDKKDINYISLPIEIGLSTSNNIFGTLVYTTSSTAVNSTWTKRTFTFIAPNNGQYITVRQQGGTLYDWVQIDNFSFNCSINLNLGNDTTICQGQTLALSGGSATSYLWSNGSTAPSINASTSGTYWVQASNGLCSATDSITISINQYPIPNLGNDTTLCQGQTLTLSGGSAISYLWSNGSTAPSINASTPGTYWVQASNGLCSATDSITISINQYPIPNLGNDTTICQGQTLALSGGSAISYLWSNGSTAPSINASTPGTYWLQASNGQCSKVDSLSIYFSNCEIEIELPNVFTPNNDGLNDNFIPIKCNGITKITLQIFNRWGEELFYTNNILHGWNGYYKGNICSDGTYFCIVQYATMRNESKAMTVFFTLIK